MTAPPRPDAADLWASLDVSAGRHGDRPAFLTSGQVLSHAEVAERGAQAARALAGLGLRPGQQLVLVAAQRSASQSLVLLGALRAGAVVTIVTPPASDIDQALPADFVVSVGEQARAGGAVALTAEEILARSGSSTVKYPEPGAPALYLQTTGTSGRPRRVLLSHRALFARVTTLMGLLPREDGRMWAARTPVTSVDSLRELFMTLLAGASLAFPPRPDLDVGAEASFWSHAGVTSVITVPSVARLMLTELPPGAGQLRDWVLTGEPVPVSLITAMTEAMSGCRLYNVYGCAEAPGCGTLLRPGYARDGHVTVPVGPALPGAELGLAGTDGGPAGDGEIADVYLGGPGVAWGYDGDPRATAAAFVPDESVPGGRRFRTGDLAVREGPWVHLVGRRDRRVKLLGKWVDLDEVEAAAAAVPGILEAAVEPATQELPSTLRAWVVPAPGHASPLLPQHVTERLQRAVGNHVVASPVHFVSELPRLPFGKVDRRALRSLAIAAPPLRERAEARDEIRQSLAAIWSEVLPIAEVLADDDFFAIGGNSLQAARVIGRIRSDLQVDLPLSAMFTARTVGALAELVRTGRTVAESPEEEDGNPVLTSEQKRLWLLDLITADSSAHVVSACASASPSLSFADIDGAIRAVAARHPALRSQFSPGDGEPEIIPGSAADIPVAHVDMSGADAAAVERHVAAFARRPIPLAHGAQLARAEYVCGPGQARRVLLSLHHIVSDAESLRIIREELLRALSGIALSPRHALRARRSRLPDPGLRRQLSAQLRPASDAIVLSPRGGTADRAKLDTRRHVVSLAQQQIDAVHRRAGELSVTPFTLLLAALSIVVSRHSGSRAFAVATPVSFRDDVAIAEDVGFFLTTTAVPCQVRQDDTLASLTQRLHSVTGTFLDGRDVPFELLVGDAGSPRAFGVNPLAQVMLVVEIPLTAATPDERIGEFVGLDHGMGTFDLVVSFEERARRLVVDTRMAAISAAEAQVLAGHLSTTVSALCEVTADRLVDDIQIHSPDEHEQLLSWARQVPRRAAIPVPERIAGAMSRDPGHRAVVCGTSAWTYGDLASAAGNLREQMRREGLRTGERVAIIDRHPLVTVAGVVACLLEGCAFVPVDPQAPAERVRLMLERAQARMVIDGDAIHGITGSHRAAGAPNAVPDQAPAYVVFTSGTTGQPKGVELPRSGLDQFMAGFCDDIGVSADSRVFQAVSFGFDPWILNTLLALTHEAELHVRPATEPPIGTSMARMLNEARATHAFISTAALETISPDWVTAAGLTVLVGGSICTAELAERWRGRIALYNLYGPSEATVLSTGKRCDGTGRPSVGRPFPGESVQVRDERGRLCPVGVPGDLHVGGAGVGISYIGQPRLTALGFTPDPLSAEPGSRMYDSGDRGYLLPDGEIHFIGRIDRQRKVRGYRLELDEIVAIVSAIPGVAAAAVDVRPNDTLSCCVASPGGRVTPAIVRTELAGQVPAWAVPNHIKVVERIPLNLNGKPDWNAIDRIPVTVGSAGSDPVAGHGDELDRTVVAAWAATLGHQEFGSRDNFFDVGGHSLLLPVLYQRLQEKAAGLSLVDLFRYPTVESQVGYLRRRGQDTDAPVAAAAMRARISQIRRRRDASARGGPADD